MKILIIGSKGFIGAALAKYLTVQGCSVIEADIVHVYGNPNYFKLDPNASDYEFEQLFKDHSFDACVNCSGAAVVSESFSNSLHDYRLNTINVYRMLNSIKIHQPNCLFITLSSAAVYGNPEQLPVKESQSLMPLSPYGFHKMQSEQICEYFSRLFDLNTVALRIFSAYGPGLKKQLFWDMYQKALNVKDKIELFGTGEETRDFIFIDDICRLIEIVIKSQLEGFKVYNVGSGVESKIRDVAKLFYDGLKLKEEVCFSQQSLPGYPSKWVADISSIEELDFKSLVPLEQGIKKYLEWVKESE